MLLAGLVLAVALGLPAEARRVALVIGNSAYTHAERLPNPTNDANAIAAALKRLQFDRVTLLFDLGAEAMRKALLAFEIEATGADIAVVFYAGHGIEVASLDALWIICGRFTGGCSWPINSSPSRFRTCRPPKRRS